MDRAKLILAVLKKYYFWLLISVMLVFGLGTWYMATSQLSSEFDQYAEDVSRRVSDVTRISQTDQHPNENIIDAMKFETRLLKHQVHDVWQKLYTAQRKEVLVWKGLDDEFVAKIDELKFGDKIDQYLRERYHNYIRENFLKLPAIVKAREPVEVGPGGEPALAPGFGPRRPQKTPAERREKKKVDEDYIVIWDDQTRILQKFEWEQTPSSLRVWVAQEDLWIYETLLNIIKNTNDEVGATGPHNAIVSKIKAFEVGKEAARGSITKGRILRMQGGGGEASEPGQGQGPVVSDEGAVGADAEGTTAEEAELLGGRYLDKEGKALGAKQTSSVDEYKRIPVRLVLQMDSQEIPRLVVQCANAVLPVEVNQVRINVDGVSQRRRVAFEPQRKKEDNSGRKKPHVEVVIQGIIYIFNPPDLKKLKLTPEELAAGPPASPDEPTTPGTQPGEPATEQPEPPTDEEQPSTTTTTAQAEPAGEGEAKVAGDATTEEPVAVAPVADAGVDVDAANTNVEENTQQDGEE